MVLYSFGTNESLRILFIRTPRNKYSLDQTSTIPKFYTEPFDKYRPRPGFFYEVFLRIL